MPGRVDSDALGAWLREEMDWAETLVLGEGYQASVRRVTTPFGDFVIKRPHTHAWLGRLVKATVAREARVYERLEGVPGVPACHGLFDGEYLVLEYVPGASLRTMQHELEDRAAFFDALLETLKRMHAAGVAHGDLKRKDNVLVGPGQRPYVIDFGIACMRRSEGGALNRRWFDVFKQMDYNAWIKLKYGRKPRKLSPADSELYRELRIERAVRSLTGLWRKLAPWRER